VEQVSKAAKSLCVWVLAVDHYGKVKANLLFREGKLKEARAKVAVTAAALGDKTVSLAEQERDIAAMQAEYRADRNEQELLERERDDTEEVERLLDVMTSNLREMQVRERERERVRLALPCP
jgi:dynein heavy chain